MTAEGNDVSDGLREAIVGALLQFDISPHDAPGMADAVLALPELAALRAKAAAADAISAVWTSVSRDRYRNDRHADSQYAAGFEDGWEHVHNLLMQALALAANARTDRGRC